MRGSRVRFGLRARMMLAFLPVTLAMAASGIFTFRMTERAYRETDAIFRDFRELQDLIHSVERVVLPLEAYLSTKHFDHLNEFLQASSSLRIKTARIPRTPSRDEGELLLKDIAFMIDSYLDEADAAMSAKRRRDIPSYIEHYRVVERLAAYIGKQTDRYNRRQLDLRTARYNELSALLAKAQLASLSALGAISVLALALIVGLTFRITGPIIALAESADRASRGDFGSVPSGVRTGDEIQSLAEAFDRMMVRIGSYIDELKEQAVLKERLKEEELRNLSMKHLLKEAELHALQSQINPHFIFNTLNAGIQLAMFEGAERSGRFMSDLSSLLRYNLRRLDQPVTLREELENCRVYAALLGLRFGDRLRYEETVDESCLSCPMPSMVLQPVLENAFLHGIDPKPEGGTISLRAARMPAGLDGREAVVVSVSDDGVGMDEELARHFFDGGAEEAGAGGSPSRARGHTTGIGLKNVRDRLRLFCAEEEVLSLDGRPGRGVTVTLKLFSGEVGVAV